MKKTSTYSRKRQTTGSTWNGAAWLNVLQRSTGYSAESPIGSWLATGTQDSADRALQRVKAAFKTFKDGGVWAGDEDNFDLIAHALGVSCIRAGQIAGTNPADNIMMPPLIAGNVAMRKVMTRRKRFGKWEMLPAEVEAVDWALEIYETILLASSPAQMTLAADMRMQAIKGQPLETFA